MPSRAVAAQVICTEKGLDKERKKEYNDGK